MKDRAPKILLVYTGGTIGMVQDYESGHLKAFDFEKLLENIPELYQLECEIHSVSFARPIDSSNMNLGHWKFLASLIGEHYERFDGFVILHGSDTMSYSASALSFMLENLAKPIDVCRAQTFNPGRQRRGDTASAQHGKILNRKHHQHFVVFVVRHEQQLVPDRRGEDERRRRA